MIFQVLLGLGVFKYKTRGKIQDCRSLYKTPVGLYGITDVNK